MALLLNELLEIEEPCLRKTMRTRLMGRKNWSKREGSGWNSLVFLKAARYFLSDLAETLKQTIIAECCIALGVVLKSAKRRRFDFSREYHALGTQTTSRYLTNVTWRKTSKPFCPCRDCTAFRRQTQPSDY